MADAFMPTTGFAGGSTEISKIASFTGYSANASSRWDYYEIPGAEVLQNLDITKQYSSIFFKFDPFSFSPYDQSAAIRMYLYGSGAGNLNNSSGYLCLHANGNPLSSDITIDRYNIVGGASVSIPSGLWLYVEFSSMYFKYTGTIYGIAVS